MMQLNNKKTILITGAAGFLGRHVSRKFSDNNYSVVGIGHNSWGDSESYTDYGIERWIDGDITYENMCNTDFIPNYIVHCAGSGSVSFSMSNPYNDFVKTVTSTAAVLEYIRSQSPETRLIYPSSAAVYGDTGNLPIQEADFLGPESPYGVHKLMAENLCHSYAKHFGISVSIIRYFSLYGEGLRKQLLWDACNKINNNDFDFFGSGTEIRDWLHIDDAVSLLWEMKNHTGNGVNIVNGGTGKGVAVKDILNHIFGLFKIQNKPKFTKSVKSGDPSCLIADSTTANKLGWDQKVDWKIGVQEYVKWFKSIEN